MRGTEQEYQKTFSFSHHFHHFHAFSCNWSMTSCSLCAWQRFNGWSVPCLWHVLHLLASSGWPVPMILLRRIELRTSRSTAQRIHPPNHGGCDNFSPNKCIYNPERVKISKESKFEISKKGPSQELNPGHHSHSQWLYHKITGSYTGSSEMNL